MPKFAGVMDGGETFEIMSVKMLIFVMGQPVAIPGTA
jgi:hypothetical protein